MLVSLQICAYVHTYVHMFHIFIVYLQKLCHRKPLYFYLIILFEAQKTNEKNAKTNKHIKKVKIQMKTYTHTYNQIKSSIAPFTFWLLHHLFSFFFFWIWFLMLIQYIHSSLVLALLSIVRFVCLFPWISSFLHQTNRLPLTHILYILILISFLVFFLLLYAARSHCLYIKSYIVNTYPYTCTTNLFSAELFFIFTAILFTYACMYVCIWRKNAKVAQLSTRQTKAKNGLNNKFVHEKGYHDSFNFRQMWAFCLLFDGCCPQIFLNSTIFCLLWKQFKVEECKRLR